MRCVRNIDFCSALYPHHCYCNCHVRFSIFSLSIFWGINVKRSNVTISLHIYLLTCHHSQLNSQLRVFHALNKYICLLRDRQTRSFYSLSLFSFVGISCQLVPLLDASESHVQNLRSYSFSFFSQRILKRLVLYLSELICCVQSTSDNGANTGYCRE